MIAQLMSTAGKTPSGDSLRSADTGHQSEGTNSSSTNTAQTGIVVTVNARTKCGKVLSARGEHSGKPVLLLLLLLLLISHRQTVVSPVPTPVIRVIPPTAKLKGQLASKILQLVHKVQLDLNGSQQSTD